MTTEITLEDVVEIAKAEIKRMELQAERYGWNEYTQGWHDAYQNMLNNMGIEKESR